MKRILAATILLLSACASPPARYQTPSSAPPPHPAPAHPVPSPSRNVARTPLHVPESIPTAGPLRTAMIGGYMDNQERDLHEHLRGLGVGVARPGDQIVLNLLESKVFDGARTDFSKGGKDALTTIAVIARHYDHTVLTVSAFIDGAPTTAAAGPQERARAVARALIADGVQASRVFAQGYSATRRVVATGQRVSIPGDRRIEIRIQAKATG